MSSLDTAYIAFKIIEHQLIIVQPLGPAAELRALKLLDDELKPFDLTIAVLNNSCHIAHQTVQKSLIGMQIVEIDLYVAEAASVRPAVHRLRCQAVFASRAISSAA